MAWRRPTGEGQSGQNGTITHPPRPPSQLQRAGIDGAAGAPAGTIIGHRVSRSGARFLFGGMLVAAAAVLVFTAALAASRNHDGSYVVADRPLPAGTVIGPDDTSTVRLGLNGATSSSAFRQASLVVGRTLAVPVGPGQLIMSSMLTTSGGAGLRPVSVPVDPDSLAALSTGVSVDVLAVPGGSGSAASASSSTMSVVMRGATLLSVSRPSSGFLSNSGTSVVVTLGVGDLAEAEQLVAAAHTGTIELVRAQPGDGTGLGPGGQGP